MHKMIRPAFVLALLIPATGVAQDPSGGPAFAIASAPGSRPASAVLKPPQDQKGLAEADIKKLVDVLSVMLPPKERDGKEFKPDAKKIDAAAAEYDKEIERLKKAYGETLVSDVAGWSEISFRLRQAHGLKSPSGFGSVQEAKVEIDRASVKLQFTYAFVIPQGYDPKKKYPLVVCLHDDSDSDKEYSGAKYLTEVLLKAPKELKDQFIFMAPTLGPKAGGKDVRIEFGDDNQFINVYAPIREMLLRFSVDADRIYLEGTGRGGELAANLVAYKPQQWSAAAIRSAMPRKPGLMANALDVPLQYHFRQGGKAANAKDAVKEIESQKTAGLPVAVVTYDPLPPNLDQRARAGMATDPVHDATGPMLAFFGDKRRRSPPKSFEFTTDKAMFGSGYWSRILKADWELGAKLAVKVDAEKNEITVTADHVEEFRLLFHDAILDLGRPVKVTVNGKVLSDGKVERSLEEFLKNWRVNRVDPWFVPCTQLDLVVPMEEKAADKPADKPADGGQTGKSGG